MVLAATWRSPGRGRRSPPKGTLDASGCSHAVSDAVVFGAAKTVPREALKLRRSEQAIRAAATERRGDVGDRDPVRQLQVDGEP